MNESARYSTFLAIGFMKRTDEEITFGTNKEYILPKDTNLLFEWWTSHFDRQHYGDPENFRVDRWLDPSDSTKLKPISHLAPFGIGRRVCPGEFVARNLQGLIVAAFIQRYTWRLAGPAPMGGGVLSIVRKPPPHKLIFTHRE